MKIHILTSETYGGGIYGRGLYSYIYSYNTDIQIW